MRRWREQRWEGGMKWYCRRSKYLVELPRRNNSDVRTANTQYEYSYYNLLMNIHDYCHEYTWMLSCDCGMYQTILSTVTVRAVWGNNSALRLLFDAFISTLINNSIIRTSKYNMIDRFRNIKYNISSRKKQEVELQRSTINNLDCLT